MSQQNRDFEDLLRRALHSAAGSVEPSPDGLERIRGRLTTPYPLPVAWMMAVYSQAARWTLGGLSSLGAWLEAVPGSVRQRRRVTRPSPSRGRRPSRVVLAAALAGTALAVAIGAGALTPPLRHAMVQTGLLIRSITSGGSGSSSRPPGSRGAVSGMAPGTGSHPQPNPANCAAPPPVLATTPTSPATSATTTASPSPTACATLPTSPTATSPSPASSSSPSRAPSSPSPTPTSPSPSPTPTSPSPSPTPTSPSPSPTPTSSSPSPTPTSSSPSLAPGSSSPSPIPSATTGPESPSAAKPASSESLGDQPRH